MVKTYGKPPYHIALLHGGPGAMGEMEPLALKLSHSLPVLEPYQTADTVYGQVAELENQLSEYAQAPYILVGYSWGAFLALLYVARNPLKVSKLILIGCPPLLPIEPEAIHQERLNRLTKEEAKHYTYLLTKLNELSGEKKREAFSQLLPLLKKSESYDPIIDNVGTTQRKNQFDFNLFEKVWGEAANMRKKGVFKDVLSKVHVSTTFIQGIADPHPIKNIKEVINKNNPLFKLIPLKSCGHTPWEERQARDIFYAYLLQEIKEAPIEPLKTTPQVSKEGWDHEM